jgi:formate dehydrogenase major subunit
MSLVPVSLVQEIDYGTPRSKAETQVALTIDGRAVTVPAGTSIMRAAMEMGTQIPKLCATDMVEAFGSCRLCLVEIEGRAGTPASCTTPVAPGMVVRTQTERLKRLRKGVMELYISDHPLDCLTCAANGDCELQDMAGAVDCATCATVTMGRSIRTQARTSPIRISPMTRRNASCAPVAYGPAKRCRARLR